MNYILKAQNGRVKYIMKQKDCDVGSYTLQDSAEWMLRENKPFRSTEFPGYPIGVKVASGTEYFFDGEWQEPQKKKRRTKDVVCE